MWRKLEDLRRSWRPWFVVGFFALLALGLYLGMRPTPPPAAYSWQASFYHGGGIFALTLLSFLAFARWPWWLRAVLLTLVGVAVELVQSLHPTRSTDWHDIVANSTGLVIGLLLIGGYQYVLRRQAAQQRAQQLPSRYLPLALGLPRMGYVRGSGFVRQHLDHSSDISFY